MKHHSTARLLDTDRAIFNSRFGHNEAISMLIADARDAALSAELFDRADAWKVPVSDVVVRNILRPFIYHTDTLI